MSHPTIAALRSLVDSRFPPSARKPTGGVPTGVAALDAALGGGLPAGRLTELVAPLASGGQLVFAQLLLTSRAARQRVALVDAADSFAPEAIPADALRHLVWVRPRKLDEALAAADVLVRDGNYSAVVLDLRGVAARVLDRTPKTLWHRLHRAAANQPGAVLVLTAFPAVPSVPWRLTISSQAAGLSPRLARDQLVARLTVEATRGHAPLVEELAG